MDLRLEGKLALVTGSTAGIGLATAIELAAEGAAIIVNGRTGERVERAVRAVRERVPAADVRGIATMEKEFFATARPSPLLQRFDTPEEVAAMIAYICSDRGSATNGAAVRVDGGVVRSIA